MKIIFKSFCYKNIYTFEDIRGSNRNGTKEVTNIFTELHVIFSRKNNNINTFSYPTFIRQAYIQHVIMQYFPVLA